MSQESTTIYVGNLNYETTEQDLKDFFSKLGSVSNARVITMFFRNERVSRGFGFVDFADQQSYNNVINSKEPLQLGNRTLRIDPARPKVIHPKDTVFLGNLPNGTTADDIKAAFNGFNIVDVRLPQPRPERPPFAFVKFETEEIQKNASEKKEVEIKGEKIPIRLARPRRGPRRFGYRRGPRRYNRRRAPRAQNQNQNANPQ